jgi:tetratricopeptide (TPR) repeat protein
MLETHIRISENQNEFIRKSGYQIIFIITLILCLSPVSNASSSVQKMEELFLLSDYSAVVEEGNRILSFEPTSYQRDEVYFYLGLSNIKLGSFAEARKNFELILNNFPASKFTERAKLSLADTYFLEEDYQQANTILEKLKENSKSDILSSLYYRLAQTNIKLGNWQAAKTYLEKLKNDFPLSFEADLAKNITITDEFFTVQTGSFIDREKAARLRDELKSQGFDSYIVEGPSQGKNFFRVRVSKLSSLKEAKELEQKLSEKNYPTKIFP